MEAAPDWLMGHVAEDYTNGITRRDTEKIAVFLREFKKYENNYDSPDAQKRLPVLVGIEHAGGPYARYRARSIPPQAVVYQQRLCDRTLVDAVSHSRYWPNTAIFIIEDDAQDGPDHVDAHRTFRTWSAHTC